MKEVAKVGQAQIGEGSLSTVQLELANLRTAQDEAKTVTNTLQESLQALQVQY